MNKIKRIVVAASAVLMALMPLATRAADAVQIESVLQVGNVTTNADYAKSTNAKPDDVVKFEVTYHNREASDSGKVAQNVKVKVDMPTAPGKVQTVTSTVAADNSNTVVDTATVNLTLDNARLEYVPGSAKWRHNTGTNEAPNWVTEDLGTRGDQVLAGGLVLENEKPCFNFAATVTFLARVRVSTVSIVKQVRVFDNSKAHNAQPNKFVVENNAKAGDTLEYVLIIKNEGNTVLKGVQVGDNLPPYLTYVSGSTLLVNSLTGSTTKTLADGITTGGITIDEMNPGSSQYVYFKAKLADSIPCGDHHLKNVGLVRATDTNQIFNVAFTNVNTVCATTVVPPVTPPTTVTPTPTPLPATGAEGATAGMVGSGALGYAVYAYRRSKRALIEAIKR